MTGGLRKDTTFHGARSTVCGSCIDQMLLERKANVVSTIARFPTAWHMNFRYLISGKTVSIACRSTSTRKHTSSSEMV